MVPLPPETVAAAAEGDGFSHFSKMAEGISRSENCAGVIDRAERAKPPLPQETVAAAVESGGSLASHRPRRLSAERPAAGRRGGGKVPSRSQVVEANGTWGDCAKPRPRTAMLRTRYCRVASLLVY